MTAQIKNIYSGHITNGPVDTRQRVFSLETKCLHHPWIMHQYWIQSLRQSECFQSRSLLVVALNILNGVLQCHINNEGDCWDLQFHFCFTMDFESLTPTCMDNVYVLSI